MSHIRFRLTRAAALFSCCLFVSLGFAAESDEETLTAEELALVKAAEEARIQAVDRVYGAVVAIYGNTRQGGGSGVLYDESGLALTNHHVVAAAGTEGWAGLADGKLYRWKLIGTDPGGDVAIIQLTGKDQFPVAPLADSDTVRVGDFAMAMGNPFVLAEDQKPTVTLGIVSGIKRYQPGTGVNMLVYGNCIQIDSSINPGNSGGPLFNMRGEVIGINGRGSFKERGRVNVGLGYAISSNQVKNFIPDLLATKVAQHGTLDAVFTDRTVDEDGNKRVICSTINLDSPAATLGLQLGDELISFEGISIKNSNQFTNIVSTLPAEWPAQLVYARDGKQHTINTRLLALPYQTQREKKPEPDKEKKEGEPKPAPQARGPKVSITDPGEIRDDSLNEQNAQRIVQRWKQFSLAGQAGDKLRVFHISDDVLQNGDKTGSQDILLATDGRFRVAYTELGVTNYFGFDGEQYWIAKADEEPATLKTAKALLNPHISQVASIAALFDAEPLSRFGKVQLHGGGKAQSQIAYRLKTIDKEGDWFYVWLSVFNTEGQRHVRLLKSGPDMDSDRSSGAVTFSDWRMIDGVSIPHHREFVKDLAEKTVRQFVAAECKVVETASDADFQIPSESASEE